MKKLTALAYYGGKSASANTGTGRWIVKLLPHERNVTYVEPFMGMLGVLLQRPRADVEVANDIDRRILCWWMAVRDHADELIAKLMLTPWSRELHTKARLEAGNEDLPLVDRAVMVHVAIDQSMASGLDQTGWRRKYKRGINQGLWKERIKALSRRLRDVQLDCTDAVDLLSRMEGLSRAVVYCDPPYRDANTTPYGGELDRDAATKSFQRQTGRVAISGYGDEWDHLGWERHELETIRVPLQEQYQQAEPRVEVLWTNYRVTTQKLF